MFLKLRQQHVVTMQTGCGGGHAAWSHGKHGLIILLVLGLNLRMYGGSGVLPKSSNTSAMVDYFP